MADIGDAAGVETVHIEDGGARPLVVLVGPPGAGKTTVGLLLARAHGVGFRDTDADVEERAGKSIPDIFVDEGEARFRALEHQAVAAALTGHTGVLALGGGAILDDATRALLKGHRVVFLEVDLADAVKRVGLDAPRPLLMGNPRARWRELMEQRRPLYTEVAAVTVNTAGRTPEEVAAEIRVGLGLTERTAPDPDRSGQSMPEKDVNR
ncbi:shikimate kinase [Embleya scabrispora]|uniref:shikimate kinase n=1 Tax=Embleya scabrispora TaxID=159449 RepID=UPI00037CF6EA|nr:shikimate kinase [Embleya scabrispora]MYS79023.1 shikimate kinase [Streptomyces sp. SID5474]